MDVSQQAINDLFEAQDGLATRTQLMELGVSASTIRYRERPEGPWRRILKGTFFNRGGRLTHWQRLRAALLYAGPGALVSGFAALWAYRVVFGAGIGVRVLIPHTRRRKPDRFVVVSRTTHLPIPVLVGHCALAPPARAAVDACLRARNFEIVRTVVSAVVHEGLCTPAELSHELDQLQVRNSAHLRALLARAQPKRYHVFLPALTRPPLRIAQ